MLELPNRKAMRYKGYNYSTAGGYFVTICTLDDKCIFGHIAKDEMKLNNKGRLVKQEIENIPSHYKNVEIPIFVVMPNHVHMIVMLTEDVDLQSGTSEERRPILGEIVGAFKAGVTRILGEPEWQGRYYDEIIRRQSMYNNIYAYIDNNPRDWYKDPHKPRKPKYQPRIILP